ncbi:hypothetical protein [Streptomyces formicae]|uniref:hypothetical protein n=1 Tax=Streptomyces formicae TaxID=1616117 RepID=UPI001F5706B7|nr:hypothetical protein [Streptomyces formicae]
MSEIAGIRIEHEAYAFACMRCGYGWEQAYEIEHHTDAQGHDFVVYKADGTRVPSPLTRPTCLNCGEHKVRIMRAGQVSSVMNTLDALYHYPVAPGIAGPVPATHSPSKKAPAVPAVPSAPGEAAEPAAAQPAAPAGAGTGPVRRRRLSDLFRSSHRRQQ